MADDQASVVSEIQDKYVPFLKKLISFLEKTKKATPDNLIRLKNIQTVFTTAPIPEQIEVFQANKSKLEKWYKSSQKDKMKEDGSRASKRTMVLEDTDSSQGESETPTLKKAKSSETPALSPATIQQIKLEKVEVAKIIQPSQPVVITNSVPATSRIIPALPPTPAPTPPTNSNDGQISFTCASCQFQTLDEQDFMKHTRTDHRSDLSMWCKQCGKCFSNAGVLVSHIKERACSKEEMVYRCGVKDCTFETSSGQTFVHHLRHCHKGSPFIFCVHCQKIFTLPHCLILHMQDDCPYKDKNRRNPGSAPPVKNSVVTKPVAPVIPNVTPRPQVLSFASKSPAIASVTSTGPRIISPIVVQPPQPSPRGRGALMPTARGRARGRGRGRGRPLSESSDSDDPDDPSWKPEEITGQQTLRRSGRWAKKVNDVRNVESPEVTKSISMAELNAKEMLHCPCCDFMAAFKSVLQDHYIAHHKVANKNACLVCHLKFEATQGFLDHFEDHASGKLTNKMVTEDLVDSPVVIVNKDSEKNLNKTNLNKEKSHTDVALIDKESIKGVVKNLSDAKVVNPTSGESQYVKIPYQAVIHDKNAKDGKLKKFEELKSPSDIIAMMKEDKLKCFFKCVLYGCSFTSNDNEEFKLHLSQEHGDKRLHCGYCLKEFYAGEPYVKHLLSQHSKRQYQCSHCFFRAYSKIHVQIHIKNFHPKDQITEVITCDPVRVPAYIKVNDESNGSLNTTWPFICAIGECNFQSFDPKEFKAHNESAHRSVSVFFCHYCKVDFLSFKRLLSHYRLHGINTFQCNYCIHGSETKDEILLHLCNAHADYPLQAFMRGSEEDASSEAKMLPYSVCTEADKLRAQSTESLGSDSSIVENVDIDRIDFESQMYEVVGETYYPRYLRSICSDLVCGIPNCTGKFENMLSYIGHLKNAHAAENFPCPHCPEVSEIWHDFKNHLMCHGPELYSCGLVTCNFYSWDKKFLTDHLESHPQSIAKVVIIREPAEEATEENDFDKIKSLPQSCPSKLSEDCFLCYFCKYKCSDKNVMKNHIYQELKYMRFHCCSCKEKFASRKDIKEHFLKIHSDTSKEIKCSVNPNPVLENIVQNLLDKNVTSSVICSNQCSNCNKNFKCSVQWQYHMCLCLQKCYQPYICNYCKQSFSSLKILKFHIDEKHFGKSLALIEVSSMAIEDEVGSKIQHIRLNYLKELCNDIPANDSSDLFVKYYKCGVCSYESNHKYNTQRHIEEEHKGNTTNFSKVLRNIKFTELSNSSLDENSNDSFKNSCDNSSSIKRYRCGFCIKKLHTLQELESHVESLHSVREESEYFYYYSPDLKTKYLPDDKELFECAYCKSGKENLHSLKKHSDLMHSESPFKVRGYVIRNHNQPASSIIACGYCYERLENAHDLKRHIVSQHPSLPQKSIGNFRNAAKLRKALEESEDIPNKRIKLGPLVFVCSHCGAAFGKQEQIHTHNRRTHARLKSEFTTINTVLADVNFYKCEFCQFTGEKQYVDIHLVSKHKTRVTCGYCNKRFEFATKLREHHDIAHKGLTVKYSQETVGTKKEKDTKSSVTTVSSKLVNPVKPQPKRKNNSPHRTTVEDPDPSYLKNIFTYTSVSTGTPTRLSVLTFSKLYNIFPRVLLKNINEK